jgi:hypothetical protein
MWHLGARVGSGAPRRLEVWAASPTSLGKLGPFLMPPAQDQPSTGHSSRKAKGTSSSLAYAWKEPCPPGWVSRLEAATSGPKQR